MPNASYGDSSESFVWRHWEIWEWDNVWWKTEFLTRWTYYWKSSNQRVTMSFDPESIIYTKISNVVNSLCFGCHLRPHDKLYFDMLRGIREVLEDESMASLTTFIPVLAHIPGDLFRHKRIKSNYQTILKFVNESVADHIRKYDENDAADLTSAFIREMKKRDTSRETTSFTGKYLRWGSD